VDIVQIQHSQWCIFIEQLNIAITILYLIRIRAIDMMENLKSFVTMKSYNLSRESFFILDVKN
jgi:hypothetical protein